MLRQLLCFIIHGLNCADFLKRRRQRKDVACTSKTLWALRGFLINANRFALGAGGAACCCSREVFFSVRARSEMQKPRWRFSAPQLRFSIEFQMYSLHFGSRFQHHGFNILCKILQCFCCVRFRAWQRLLHLSQFLGVKRLFDGNEK